ncbi:hypothetical protein BD410DRAFT_305313 [Rickenella mellea]|uniref:Mixed lineage kinase domain-containing protein n=1 Tax=Rickenella mellea TaxID=50990 RepID=A0A4Y7Q2R6_9AGAM|nr:hypothetical protein BD410DRAFT_305313 [Rickenella mellea]
MPLPLLPRRLKVQNKSRDEGIRESRRTDAVAAARAFAPVALSALMQSTDVFPPLKSAVSVLHQIYDTCERMKNNREGADELRMLVESVRDSLVKMFADETDICSELCDALIRFDQALTNFLDAVDGVRWRKNRMMRLAYSSRDAETLRTVRQRLDDATKLLMLVVTMHQSKTLHSISKTVDTTGSGVARVEGLVLEVGYMRAQLAQPQRRPPEEFFF